MFTVKSIKPDGSELICGPYTAVHSSADKRTVACFGESVAAEKVFDEQEADDALMGNQARVATKLFVMNAQGSTVAQYNI